MNCAYCITKQHHMLVMQQPDGTYHVHAPFYDRSIINTMIKEINKAVDNWQPESKIVKPGGLHGIDRRIAQEGKRRNTYRSK